MKRALELTGELFLLVFGFGGLWGMVSLPAVAAVTMIAGGAILVGLRILSVTFVKANMPWPSEASTPQPIRLSLADYVKALVAWLLGFRRSYAIAPGLYFTGDRYDSQAPLLVTANYHLTVFLLVRRVRRTNARLLVIDTDGINVWCAAGKGRFANQEILKQLHRYPREILSTGGQLRLILPKFGMSGVDLHELRSMGVRPIIGPLYAADLPEYLKSRPLRNRSRDRVHFNIQSRAFVWLPGMLQLASLLAGITGVFWLLTALWGTPVQLGIIVIGLALGTAYALLFPLIPGRRFAVKGLMLGLFFSGIIFAASWVDALSMSSMFYIIPFTIAAGILIGLEFTGNSAVSNYSRVKREIVSFLPVSALLFLVSIGTFFAMEVLS